MSKIIGIKYIAPLLDGSGYARAARDYVLALYNLGIQLTIEPMVFEQAKPDFGKSKEIFDYLIGRDIEYNIVLIHSTPEFYSKYKEAGKLNIGYTIWETTKLHTSWSRLINNNIDKVMVGCDWNVEVFKESGVTIPICCIPHTISNTDANGIEEYNISGIKDSTYVFGFVGQFTERKDPVSLLKAFWYAFQNKEDVALVFKSYRSDYSDQEKEAVKFTIQKLKKVTVFDNYPPIHFIPDMLTEDEMRGLYKRMDCYLSLDRGEGFGLAPFTAGAYGKPVIATGFGGVNQYLKKDNSYLVDYTLTPVHGMPYSPWYNATQLWAQANVLDGAKKMREVFTNQPQAKVKGLRLKEFINTNFSYEVIGKKIVKEIEVML